MPRRVPLAVMLLVIGLMWGCEIRREAGQQRPRDTDRRVVNCAPPYRIAILDLDMTPDPVRQGQPIDAWRITLQSDRDGACSTLLEVRDQNEFAGRGAEDIIRPGKATYTIPAIRDYRLQRRDTCFIVQVNVGGFATALEARRTFCARPLPGDRWSLRER